MNRAATPNLPTEPASPESIAADEALLVQLGTAVTDIKAFELQTWKLWREELHILLPESEALASAGSDSVNLEGDISSSFPPNVVLICCLIRYTSARNVHPSFTHPSSL